MTDAVPPPAPEGEEAPERQSTPFLVLQFFIFPMAIVAVCVTVFIVFGLIASEDRGAREYLAEVRSGGANRRWQAAFELSRVLLSQRERALRDPRFVPEAVALFDESEKDDPRVRRYLALALGRLGDARAVPSLAKVAAGAGDPETVVYSIWALGTIADPRAVPDLVRLAAAEDAGVRKAAVHALGVFPGEDARAALRAALEDAVDDVRWNAALALARHEDPAAAPLLRQMLDRAALESVRVRGATGESAPLPAEQVEQALFQAASAAAALDDPSLTGALEALRDGDPSLRVREAARQALAARAPAR